LYAQLENKSKIIIYLTYTTIFLYSIRIALTTKKGFIQVMLLHHILQLHACLSGVDVPAQLELRLRKGDFSEFQQYSPAKSIPSDLSLLSEVQVEQAHPTPLRQACSCNI